MTIIEAVSRPAGSIVVPSGAPSDSELLRRFISDHSEAAFEELMQRHGPMVMGVCRRVLRKCQDAEDAYQATFLLLVQKSASIRRPEQLANWLFGVAYRVASRIRVQAAKQGSSFMETSDIPGEDSTLEVAWRELQSVLDEELHQLPEKQRMPLILCVLQGKTHVEAARELGWPTGSMSARVTQARERLRRRLVRRGLTFSATLFALLLAKKTTAAPLSPAIVELTTRAAVLSMSGKARLVEVVSPSVVELLNQMSKWMLLEKIKRVSAASLLVVFLLGTTANIAWTIHESEQKVYSSQSGFAVVRMVRWMTASAGSTFHGLTSAVTGKRSSTTGRTMSQAGLAGVECPAVSACGAR